MRYNSGMKYKAVRKKYLEFFKKNEHAIIPSASLVPENDPSTLFVNSGMLPLVPFLLGEKHPNGTKLANSQRCVRTIDIDEVGDAYHCTTFEMLGNWSINDYFKETAINLTVSFFVDELGLDINRIYASVFEGNKDVPMDRESIRTWEELFKARGIEAKVGRGERIQAFGKKENWWELANGGPCGPDSEIFYDIGMEKCSKDCNVSCNCGKYVEIGNNVFMEFLKEGNTYKPLGKHNVDFGGGLDRLAMLLQNKDSVFETDIYNPIFKQVQSIAEKTNITSERIITDHIKAATWIIMDGVSPGRTEREYVLRRLIRRAIRHARLIGIKSNFTSMIGKICIEQWKDIWVKLEEKQEEILSTLDEEENKFNKTLQSGLKEVEKIIKQEKHIFKNEDGLSFKIYETHGFPPEMLIEELEAGGIKIDKETFWKNHQKQFEEHQEKSRTASAGLFKGGMSDSSQNTIRLHTVTHLLLRALYDVLGDHIHQKGSNINPERLRLDFPSERKLTDEEIDRVENIVNEQIEKGLDIFFEEKSKEEAINIVPYASFEDKYQENVKIYYIGDKKNPYTVEICNGPHVKNTKDLGKFKIIKQENVGSNIKRIKAILE
jgi:alanyl-tRNA synthetase